MATVKENMMTKINELLVEYQQRVEQNHGDYHKNLTLEEVTNSASAMGAIGAGVGSVAPGLGTAVGAATGVLVGIAASGIKNIRINKKLRNSERVLKYLGDNKEEYVPLLTKAVDTIVKQRKAYLEPLHHDNNSKKKIADYLAVNLMAAIKHSAQEHYAMQRQLNDKLHDMVTGVRDIRSNKISSKTIEVNHKPVTLTQIAQYTPHKPTRH